MSTTTVAAQAVVDEVRQAAQAWAALPAEQRAVRLREAGRQMLAGADELAALISAETGKPLAESLSSEVVGVADLFGYWCKHGADVLRPRSGRIPKLEMPGKRAWVERRPRGVVAMIAPWNYPVAIPMRTIIPALLAGNGVVLKPSEVTPGSGRWLVERLRAALGPIVGLLEGDGTAGAALIAASPDMVVFTGSTATGRKVAVACAERGIVCDCELGGKDCAIVLDDADVQRAAAGIAWGILTNAGQNCAAIERVAVHAGIADRFVPALIARLALAAPHVPELTTGQQKAIVTGQITDALARGARLLTGGLPEGDAPLPPTLLTDVPRDAAAWRDETFGPMAVLEVLDDDDALVAAANDCAYDLGLSVWSGDEKRALAMAERVRTGMVWLNNHAFTGSVPDLPWSGVAGSGSGVTSSPEALLHMTRPRMVLVDGYQRLEPWWYPYGESMVALMHAVIKRQRSGGLGATLGTLKALKQRNKDLNS